ncbi:MAG TPA: glycosyltransferase [Candidatus Binatia bacterium]|jgi:cellulose synthase/poly-beta-1,6-N-acetylglucosamine synthase-like glycosyltransferase|nr:glycosyltransferase [Candidatus Binatia bacterium]
MLNSVLQALAVLALSGLALYGLLGLFTLFLYWRHRAEASGVPFPAEDQLPPVTVQLPIYNERYVVDRLLEATAALRYPRDRLQIQVLDDSEDDTTLHLARLVSRYRAQGLRVELRHRARRDGYKAGALSAGLQAATGDLIAIFDADFAPQPDFLLQTVPHFLDAPELGLVQTRWGHLNASESALTAAQALALDKHFAVEQTVRFRADLFPKFNGTAGVWRRACLEDAGGWHSDTVCEDLCLSTRAVLRGWRCRYLPDVVAPAELPGGITAYKNQQARWAKGSTQCLLKFGRQILRSSGHRPFARLYALLTMAAYSTSILLILLLLLQIPLALLNVELPSSLALLGVAGLGQPLLFVLGQRMLHRDWKRRLRYLPALLFIAIGLSPTIMRAVLQGLFQHRHNFVRTPKRGDRGQATCYRLPFDRILYYELFLTLYAILAAGIALWRDATGALPFLTSCAIGFGIVAHDTLRERMR